MNSLSTVPLGRRAAPTLTRLAAFAVAGLVLTLLPAPAVAQAEPERDVPSTLQPAIVASSGLSAGASCAEVRADPKAYAKGNQFATCDQPANAKGVTARQVVDRLSGGSVSAAVRQLPAYCGTLPLGSWAIHPEDRTQICRVDMRELYVVRVSDGVIVGWISYGVASYSYTSPTSLEWGHQIQIGALNTLGDVAGIQAQGALTCSGACSTRSMSFPAQSVLSVLATGEAAFVSTLLTGAAAASTTATYRFTKPGALDSGDISIQVPRVRCDDLITRAGCVFVDGRPAMVYSISGPYSELAIHIYDAQQSGLPGDYFRNSPLTRTTNSALTEANRHTACPPRYPSVAGRSCDEYPFASTNQGAWVMELNGGRARTFTYCQVPEPTGVVGAVGWSACLINESHNSGGGGALLGFYDRNRVVDNDVFHVAIVG